VWLLLSLLKAQAELHRKSERCAAQLEAFASGGVPVLA
jgi:hypothetical protein